MKNNKLILEEELSKIQVKEEVAIYSVLVVIVCIVALIAIEYFKEDIENHIFFFDLSKTLLLTIFSIFVFKVFWDLSAKNKFAKHVASICGISYNIRETGIVSVNYLFNDVRWSNFYDEANEIELALFHGSQTLNLCEHQIKECCSREKPPKIRIKFPNYENSELLEQIASLEPDSTPEDFRNDIQKSIKIFQRLSSKIADSDIKVYVTDSMFPFSIYKSDKRSIVMLSKNPSDDHPVMIACDNKGSFYQYIQGHFENICESAKLAKTIPIQG